MAENNSTIIWDGEEIDEIKRDSLELEKIDENGTIKQMVETINSNFQELAEHGGGPAGIDGTNGVDGLDGTNVEYIYCLSNLMNPNVQYPSDQGELEDLFDRVDFSGHASYPEDNGNVVWYNHAWPISEEHKNEYVLSRYKIRGLWAYSSKPVLWAHWGENGTDGDGVEYVFLTSKREYTSDELDSMFIKKVNMDIYQRALYNIDDFYPGMGWFIDANKNKAKKALDAAGAIISTSEFNERWRICFNLLKKDDLTDSYYNWSDDPTGANPIHPYEYVSIRRSSTDESGIREWTDYSTPTIWSHYGLPTRTFIIYFNAEEGQIPATPQGGWWDVESDVLITVGDHAITPAGWRNFDNEEDGKIAWLSSGVFDYTGKNVQWTKPVRITGAHGKKGADGALIEFIYAISDSMNVGVNYPQAGTNNENWDKFFDVVNNPTTDNVAFSGYTSGTDGDGLTYINFNGTHWYDNAKMITHEKKREYVWMRTRVGDEGSWEYSEPTIWAQWGEDGTDGDGVEYIFHLHTADSLPNNLKPVTLDEINARQDIAIYANVLFQMNDFYPGLGWFTDERKNKAIEAARAAGVNSSELELNWNALKEFFDRGWTDNPTGTDPCNIYEFVSVRKKTAVESPTGVWYDFGEPAIWGNYNNRTRTYFVYKSTADKTNPPTKPSGGVWDSANDLFVENDSTHPLTGGWSRTQTVQEGENRKFAWVSTGEFHEDDYVTPGKAPVWSDPFRITGDTGVSISNVVEYFHADTSINPSDLKSTPVTNTNYWKTDKSQCGWGLNKLYLFNVEEIVYSNGFKEVLEPHFVASWGIGILDVVDYYILEPLNGTNNDNDPGDVAPRMNNNGTPILTPSVGHTTEGKDYWTTNASYTRTSKEWPMLWNITKRIYENDKPDDWTSPLVVGVWGVGDNGKDSVYADLDNEMDAIQIDENLKVLSNRTCETTVTMFKGPEKTQIIDIDVSGEDTSIINNCTYTYYSNGSVVTGVTSSNIINKNIDAIKLTFTVQKNIVVSNISAKIVITVTSIDGDERTVTYTLACTTHPAIYILQPTPGSIINDGTGNTVNQVTLKVTELIGENTYVYENSTNVGDKFKLYVRKNSGSKEDITSTFTKSTSGLGVGDALIFTVEIDTDGNDTYETIIDQETVWVMKQGTDGDDVQRRYAQYVDSWGTYKDIKSISADGSTITFRDVNNVQHQASTTSYPRGADDDHCIEAMSEKIGDGSWSLPIPSSRHFSQDEVIAMINDSINDSNQTLVDFVERHAGDEITEALGSYATTSDMQTYVGQQLTGYQPAGNYVTSSAFNTYKSDASKKFAQAETIVGNATFEADSSGYLIYKSNGTSSTYKTLADYYSSLSTSEKTALDTDNTGKGLDDLVVVNNLLNKMKGVFRMTYTELATIKQSVNNKVSMTQIVNSISNGASNIKAAITSYANESGSGINLDADRINLSASHQLNLSTGTFTINSDNLKLDGNGLTLTSKNGATRIDANGILHASGAEISGTITANEFEATSGSRTTSITGEQFIIRHSGGNSVYISIESSVSDGNGGTRTNVPTLCMSYNGEKYILNPSNWLATGSDSSRMGFTRVGSLKPFTIKPSISHEYTGTSSSISYSLFPIESDGITASITSPNALYKFNVADLGNASTIGTNKTLISNNGLAKTTTDINTINSTGAYTWNTGAGDYASITTQINSTNCSTLGGLLPSSWTVSNHNLGFICQATINNKYIDSLASNEEYGIDKVYDFMMKYMGAKPFNNSNYGTAWTINGNSSQLAYLKTNYASNIPESSHINTIINAYPIITVGDSNRVLNNTNKILVNCSYELFASGSVNNQRFDYYNNNVIASSPTGTILDFHAKLGFNFILTLSTAISASDTNALSTSALSAVSTFLKNFNHYDNNILNSVNIQGDIYFNGDFLTLNSF